MSLNDFLRIFILCSISSPPILPFVASEVGWVCTQKQRRLTKSSKKPNLNYTIQKHFTPTLLVHCPSIQQMRGGKNFIIKTKTDPIQYSSEERQVALSGGGLSSEIQTVGARVDNLGNE